MPIVLPSAPTDSDNPRLGWENFVTSGNIAASSAEAGSPASNLANPTTFQLWRAADVGAVDLTVTFINPKTVSYVGIARHNFGSAGISYTLQGSTDGGATFDDLASTVLPSDDGVILHEFDPIELDGLRIQLGAGSDFAEAAVVHVGGITIMQRRLYVGHTPITYARQTTVSTGMSESGQFLGRVVRRQQFGTSIKLQNLTPAWYRENLAPFDEVAAVQPFFWAWRPNSYPNEVAYCWVTEDPQVSNDRANGMMGWSINAQGILT